MTRQEMVNELIKERGFEHESVINFCEICETWISDDAIKNIYDIIKKDATINVLNRGKLYWLGFTDY